jgi:hypothetical protein
MSDSKEVAFLFLTYEHIVHRKNPLLKKYLDNTNVYIHPKHPDKITDEFQKNIVPHRINTEWGKDTIVIATLLLLWEAYKNSANKWFVLCSEDIFPYRTYDEFLSYLGSRKRSMFSLMQNDTKLKVDLIVKTQQWWMLTRDDVGLLFHGLNLDTYRDAPSHLASYIRNQPLFTTIQKNIPTSAVLDEWFFLSALKIEYKTHYKKKGSYHYDNVLFCYTKWFPWISRHPTVFNRLLPNDREYLDAHESCFFIRKTFPTFENKVEKKKTKNSIIVVIGTKNKHIRDYSTFLSHYKKNSDIFLLVMIDKLSDIENSDILHACCQCYSVVWNQVEEACASLRQFMNHYYTNVMVIPENQNANEWKEHDHNSNDTTNQSDWIKVMSERYKKYYWYNTITGESSWKNPTSSIVHGGCGGDGSRKARRIYTNQNHTKRIESKKV